MDDATWGAVTVGKCEGSVRDPQAPASNIMLVVTGIAKLRILIYLINEYCMSQSKYTPVN